MRTTVTLEPDVVAAVNRLRTTQGLGVSEALNQLARAGMVSQPPRKAFKQRTANLGTLLVDVSNVQEALDVAEGPGRR